MKNIVSTAEIALWDTAISVMSNVKTHHTYSITVAALTLRLQPYIPSRSRSQTFDHHDVHHGQVIRLVAASILGLTLGTLVGWLSSL